MDHSDHDQTSAHLLLEEVLSVLQRAQLDLFLLVLQLGVGKSEVRDQIVERLENLLDGQKHRRAALGAQTVELSVKTASETSVIKDMKTPTVEHCTSYTKVTGSIPRKCMN